MADNVPCPYPLVVASVHLYRKIDYCLSEPPPFIAAHCFGVGYILYLKARIIYEFTIFHQFMQSKRNDITTCQAGGFPIKNKIYCLTLDLKNDPDLIRQYEQYHRQVWPEIIGSIKDSGIENMQIFRYDARLFMILEVNETFSFEQKQIADQQNPKVQEWEELMWKYQQSLPGSSSGEKWKLMDKIFDLTDF